MNCSQPSDLKDMQSSWGQSSTAFSHAKVQLTWNDCFGRENSFCSDFMFNNKEEGRWYGKNKQNTLQY